MSNKKTKLYLGLDLGITSIGWSVSKDTIKNNQITTEIDDMGVILWDPPFETVKKKKYNSQWREKKIPREKKKCQ